MKKSKTKKRNVYLVPVTISVILLLVYLFVRYLFDKTFEILEAIIFIIIFWVVFLIIQEYLKKGKFGNFLDSFWPSIDG